jgi:Glycosyl hydrolases family 25
MCGRSTYKLSWEEVVALYGLTWDHETPPQIAASLAINPLVVDLSHHNEVADFGNVKAAGIAGIIHKATEAIGFVDKMYAVRRGSAMDASLLWGPYDFLRPVSIPAQVDFFLKIAAPENATLLALDHEDGRVPLINRRNFCSGSSTRSVARQCCIPGPS